MNSLAKSKEEVEEIYLFRRRIYAEQEGINYFGTVFSVDENSVRFDQSTLYFQFKESGKLIATAEADLKNNMSDELTRLGIHPGDQKKYRFQVIRHFVCDKTHFTTEKRISFLEYIFETLLYAGIDYTLIEAEEEIVEFYKSLGLKILWSIAGESDQKRVLMFWFTKDLSHFQKIKSPFTKILLDYLNKPESE